MRVMRWMAAILLVVPLMAAGEAFDTAYRSAMASYYAALLASVHHDPDGTVRHVMLLKSRWATVVKLSRTGAPPPLRDDPDWGAALTTVAAQAARAGQLASKRDTAGAHSELEAIRGILYDARTKYGVRTFDDDLTEYHDAVERLTGVVGARNEIRFKAEDFAAITRQTERARRAWMAVEAAATPVKAEPAWSEASAKTRADMAALETAAGAHDSVGVSRTGELLHEHYLELLAALSGR
jgi:hypothetical protein